MPNSHARVNGEKKAKSSPRIGPILAALLKNRHSPNETATSATTKTRLLRSERRRPAPSRHATASSAGMTK